MKLNRDIVKNNPELTTERREKFAAGDHGIVGNETGFDIQRKHETIPVDLKNEGSTDEIWISTEQADRSGDVIVASGVEFDDYMKNPVVGYNHGFGQMQIPIARTTEIDRVAGVGISAKFQWPPWHFENPQEGIEHVDNIHKLWRGFFINAASIWVSIHEWEEIDDPNNEFFFQPWEIKKSKLIEWALVYVPMNQGATRKALKLLGEERFYRKAVQRAKKREIGQKSVVIPPKRGDMRNVIVRLSNLNADMRLLDDRLTNLGDKINE